MGVAGARPWRQLLGLGLAREGEGREEHEHVIGDEQEIKE